LGLLYIAGVIVIYLLNGEITDNLPSQVVTVGLILVGGYIMLPRRLTATCQERRSIRVYNFSFGLVRHRRVVAFDESWRLPSETTVLIPGRRSSCGSCEPEWRPPSDFSGRCTADRSRHAFLTLTQTARMEVKQKI
jgi:hypothetical protein